MRLPLLDMGLRTGLWWVAAALLTTASASTWGVQENYFGEIEVQPWSAKQPGSCRILPDYRQDGQLEVVCVGLSTLGEVEEKVNADARPNITSLTITQSNLTRITLDDLQAFPTLTSLAFNNSLLSGWSVPTEVTVPKVTRLVLYRCQDSYSMFVQATYPAIALTSKMLNSLPEIEELHLVDCYLYNLHLLSPPPSLHHLTIQGGGAECCDESLWVLEWMKEGRAQVTKNTTCFMVSYKPSEMETKFSFFNKLFLTTMGHWQAMVRDCPNLCTCKMNGVKDNQHPIMIINCSFVGLTHIPETIPELSTTIYLNNNAITNFSHVFTNPLYHHMDQIYLQHNRITRMDGRLFYLFARDRPLDLSINLSYNHLSNFPVEDVQRLYDEALENGIHHLPVFHLGYNPWNCDDCSFLPGFQKIVYHQYEMHRYLDIRCQDGPREETAKQQVVKLDVVGLCQPDPPVFTPIDVLILCLAGLLILFLLNFLHNFIQYRRHGKLPCIITKLPCC